MKGGSAVFAELPFCLIFFYLYRYPISLMKIVLIVTIDEHYLLQRNPISFFDNVAVAVDRAHSTRTCAPQDFLLALRLLSLGARKLFPWATIVVARAENFISRLKLFHS